MSKDSQLSHMSATDFYDFQNLMVNDVPYLWHGENRPLTLAQRALLSMDYELMVSVFNTYKMIPPNVSLTDIVMHNYRHVNSDHYDTYQNNVQRFIQLFVQYDNTKARAAFELATNIGNTLAQNALRSNSVALNLQNNQSDIEGAVYDAIYNNNIDKLKIIISHKPDAFKSSIPLIDGGRKSPVALAYLHMRGNIIKYLASLYQSDEEFLRELPAIWSILSFSKYIHENTKNYIEKVDMCARFINNIEIILELVVYKLPYFKIESDKCRIIKGVKTLIQYDVFAGVQAYIKHGLPMLDLKDISDLTMGYNLSYNLMSSFIKYTMANKVSPLPDMRNICEMLSTERNNNIMRHNVADLSNPEYSDKLDCVTTLYRSVLLSSKEKFAVDIMQNNIEMQSIDIDMAIKNNEMYSNMILQIIYEDNLRYLMSISAKNAEILKMPIQNGFIKAPPIYWAYNAMRGEMVKYLSSLYANPADYIVELRDIECIFKFPSYLSTITKSIKQRVELFKRFECNINIICKCVIAYIPQEYIQKNQQNILLSLWETIRCNSVCGVKAYIIYGLPLPEMSYALEKQVEYKTSAIDLLVSFMQYVSGIIMPNNEYSMSALAMERRVILQKRSGYDSSLQKEILIKNNIESYNDNIRKAISAINHLDSIHTELMRLCKLRAWTEIRAKIKIESLNVVTLANVLQDIMNNGCCIQTEIKNSEMQNCIIDVCTKLKSHDVPQGLKKITIPDGMRRKIVKNSAFDILEKILDIKVFFAVDTIPLMCKAAMKNNGRVFDLLTKNLDVSNVSASKNTKLLLHMASKHGKVDMVKKILSFSCVPIDMKDLDGSTPVMVVNEKIAVLEKKKSLESNERELLFSLKDVKKILKEYGDGHGFVYSDVGKKHGYDDEGLDSVARKKQKIAYDVLGGAESSHNSEFDDLWIDDSYGGKLTQDDKDVVIYNEELCSKLIGEEVAWDDCKFQDDFNLFDSEFLV